MRAWRPSRSRQKRSNQPFLPGLFVPTNSPGATKSSRHTPSSPTQTALELARIRLGFMAVCFGLLFFVFSGRLALLTLGHEIQEAPPLQARSANVQVTARADIVDRNGTVLATSLPTMMLTANTQKILDPEDAAKKLKSVFSHFDSLQLEQTLRAQKRYVVLQRHLTPRQYYEVNKMGIAGLEYVPDESRIYPTGALAAHVLGYTDIDNHGIAGLEKKMDKVLQTNAEPLVSSLDLRLQTILHRELQQAVDTFKATGATGLIMDAENGEIHAIVSLPDFNPQNAGAATDEAKFNRATLGVYEMGSTFKSFNTAMALDSCGIKPAQRFDTTQPIPIGGKTIRDFHSVDHWLNVAEIFIESSNIGSARMAQQCGRDQQRAFLQALGLTQKPNLEIPEVGAPLVPLPSRWSDATTMTVAFGHGIAVNAVQVAAAHATLVNGGYAVQPTLLKRKTPLTEKKQVVSERTSAQMRALMRLVVKYGTAKQADVPGYLVGGKTGTADKIQGRGYNENARISSFIGVFPANAPRYVVLALLDDPKGNAKTYGYATGGWTAAPVVGRIVSQIGPLLNLPPVEVDVLATAEERLLRPLGTAVLESLNINKDTDYAAIESHSTH